MSDGRGAVAVLDVRARPASATSPPAATAAPHLVDLYRLISPGDVDVARLAASACRPGAAGLRRRLARVGMPGVRRCRGSVPLLDPCSRCDPDAVERTRADRVRRLLRPDLPDGRRRALRGGGRAVGRTARRCHRRRPDRRRRTADRAWCRRAALDDRRPAPEWNASRRGRRLAGVRWRTQPPPADRLTCDRGEVPHVAPPGDDDHGGDEAGALNLPEAFWKARPVLGHVHAAAWSRARSADALLAGVLARACLLIPPTLTLPPIVGDNASLNLFVNVVGPPGAGKSTGVRPAERLLPTARVDVVHGAPVGSGEGIAELFLRRSTTTTSAHPGGAR